MLHPAGMRIRESDVSGMVGGQMKERRLYLQENSQQLSSRV